MILFYLLITVMPLERHPIWERMVGEATVVKYLGLACVAYAMVHLMARGRAPRLLETAQARVFLPFVLATFVSYWTMGASVPIKRSFFLTYLSMLMLFFVTLTVVDSIRRLRWVLLVSLGSVAFGSLYVIREWQKSGFSGTYRPGWVVGDPNYFGISVLVALPIGYYFLREAKHPKWERLYCLGCIALILVGLVAGQSRGAFLGLVLELLWVLWHARKRVTSLLVLAILVLPPLFLAPSSPLQRLLHPAPTTMASTRNHFELLKAGLLMTAHNPVVGVGLGNFEFRVLTYAHGALPRAFIAHDAYLEVAAEMGVPMLILYLLVLYFSLRALGRVRRRVANPLLALSARAVEAALVGSSVAQFFVSGQYQKLYWLMIFLSMAIAALAREEREGAGEAVEPATTMSRVWQPVQPQWGARPTGTASLKENPYGPPGKALPARR